VFVGVFITALTCKRWLTDKSVAAQGVLSLKWGEDAKTLFVGAADHNLRIFGVPS
jgi:hypothetical protein